MVGESASPPRRTDVLDPIHIDIERTRRPMATSTQSTSPNQAPRPRRRSCATSPICAMAPTAVPDRDATRSACSRQPFRSSILMPGRRSMRSTRICCSVPGGDRHGSAPLNRRRDRCCLDVVMARAAGRRDQTGRHSRLLRARIRPPASAGGTVGDWPLNVFDDEQAAAELPTLRAIAAADIHNLVFQVGGDVRIIPATVNERNA